MTFFPNNIKCMNDFWYEWTYNDLRTNLSVFTNLRAEARWQQCDSKVCTNCLQHEITLACFKYDMRLETGMFTSFDDFVMQVKVVFVQYEGFIS